MRRRHPPRRLASWRDLRFGLWQPSVRDEVDEELAQHLELRARELAARGLDPTAARAEALRRFGDLDRIRQDCRTIGEHRERTMRRLQWIGELRQDLFYALRQLRRSPAFAAVTILTLALGIGATTAIFAVANGILLKPMPYRDPARLLLVWDDLSWIGVPEAFVAGPEVLHLRRTARLFTGFAAVRSTSLGLTDPGSPAEPTQLRLTSASANFFDLLGSRPAIGRGFAPGDDRAGMPLVLVISDNLWRRRYGGDPGVIGRVVDLDGARATIVGVLPRDFRFATQQSLASPSVTDAYIPLQADLTEAPDGHRYSVLARIRDGVAVRQALAELATISANFDRERYGAHGFRFVPIAIRERLVREVRPALLALLGAVALLALIMCANLATIALSRAARREREFAVRTAIGAGRGRITRQVLTETLVLSLAGSAMGIGFAWAGIRGLVALAPPGLPRRDEIGVDPVVVLFTLALAIVVGVIVALAPVWFAARRDVSAVMRERAPTLGANRARGILVTVQVALSLMLLTATGLLVASFAKLVGVRPGFDARSVITIDVRASNARYAPGPAIVTFIGGYVDRLRALPGVQAVGAVSAAPLSGNADQYSAGFPSSMVKGTEGSARELVDYAVSTPGYFDAMRMELLPGSRDFATADRAGAAPVAIIDELLAKKYYPSTSAIGQQIIIYGDTAATIVGVAKHVRLWNIRDEAGRSLVYRPHAQAAYRGMTIAVRTPGDVAQVEREARAALRELDPAQPLSQVRPMAEIVAQSLGEQRLVMVLVLGFAATALVLAMLGVYGVAAAAVTQRTRELGIRMALGAQTRNVMVAVLRRPIALVAMGVALGIAGALLLARLLQGLLYGMSATDPRVLAAVVVLIVAVAVIAGYLPARSATKVDPAAVLRAE